MTEMSGQERERQAQEIRAALKKGVTREGNVV